MPIRSRKKAYLSRKKNIKRKRKKPMEFDQLASPHEGDLHIKNEVSLEPAAKRLFLWCYNIMPSMWTSITYAGRFFFSSHVREKLDTTQAELQDAKQELKIISEKLIQLESKVESLSRRSISSAPPICSIPLPAPPPPPPPPPPMLKPITEQKKLTVGQAKQTKKSQVDMKQQNVGFSLDDILNVKLKKPEQKIVRDKENKVPSIQPRITLSDITSITLKSSRQNFEENKEPSSTPKSALLKRALRKTSLKRSPGGMPIVRRDLSRSTAVGPTPEIERALRRKFRSIRTSPLTEENCLQSPV